jgi:hypothetical protein
MLWPDDFGWPQDIGGLAILDGSRLLDESGRFRIDHVRTVIEARLHLVPRFRQLLHFPRRGLGTSSRFGRGPRRQQGGHPAQTSNPLRDRRVSPPGHARGDRRDRGRGRGHGSVHGARSARQRFRRLGCAFRVSGAAARPRQASHGCARVRYSQVTIPVWRRGRCAWSAWNAVRPGCTATT